MSQNTLYLKYRPKKLDEIIGKEEIVKVLKNSIKQGNLAHAYLFTGTRGTGKTTTARAFAKELGIHKDDILELDAASNRKLEDIQSLNETTYTLPFFSKYKMYILDEVHMLTKEANNAFLKTLEEPPEHVIFVLCTTDPEKLPETILSRCIKFNLKSPNLETLNKYLESVCKREDVKIDKEGVNLIALSGNGSYRDSLSNLQKILSFSETKYTEEFVGKILGIAPTKAIFSYLKSLDGIETIESGIGVLKSLEESGVDNILFGKELTYYARLVLLSRHKLLSEKDIKESYGEHILEFIKVFADNTKGKINSAMLAKIIESESISRNSSIPYLVYELILLA